MREILNNVIYDAVNFSRAISLSMRMNTIRKSRFIARNRENRRSDNSGSL